jgi:hypothetical protein
MALKRRSDTVPSRVASSTTRPIGSRQGSKEETSRSTIRVARFEPGKLEPTSRPVPLPDTPAAAPSLEIQLDRAERFGHHLGSFSIQSGGGSGPAPSSPVGVIQLQRNKAQRRKRQNQANRRKNHRHDKKRKEALRMEPAEEYDEAISKLKAESSFRKIPSEHQMRQLSEGVQSVRQSPVGKAKKANKVIEKTAKAYGIREQRGSTVYDPNVKSIGSTVPGKPPRLGPRAFRETARRVPLGNLSQLDLAGTIGHENFHAGYSRDIGSITKSLGGAAQDVAKQTEQEHRALLGQYKRSRVNRDALANMPPDQAEQLRQSWKDQKKQIRAKRQEMHEHRNLARRLKTSAEREEGLEEGIAYEINKGHYDKFREEHYQGAQIPPSEEAALGALTTEVTNIQGDYLKHLTDDQRLLFQEGRYGEALASIRKKINPETLEELVYKK